VFVETVVVELTLSSLRVASEQFYIPGWYSDC
jgi:hypothetical protein